MLNFYILSEKVDYLAGGWSTPPLIGDMYPKKSSFFYALPNSGCNLLKVLHVSLRSKAPTKNPLHLRKSKPELPENGRSEDTYNISKKSCIKSVFFPR